ncbi:FAD-dependent oxidoreductase, partial [Escherichia coli]|nr:FAD-dependent oxidoreductase [Escherichia coli]
GFSGLFAQQRNLFNPRFWMMLRDLLRFYRETPAHAGKLGLLARGEFLEREGYGRAFRDDHLLPMAAAIWSAPASALLEYPA